MTRLIPIEDDPSYAKDSFSNALVNKDVNMLAEFKARRAASKQMKQMREEINMLKAELNTIKTHLNLR